MKKYLAKIFATAALAIGCAAPLAEPQAQLEAPSAVPARLVPVFGKMRQSKTGAATVDYILSEKVLLKADAAQGGAYDPADNSLNANPSFTDDDLLLTVTHETRHVKQFRKIMPEAPPMAPSLHWITRSLMEVDACTSAVEFSVRYEEETVRALVIDKPTFEGATVRNLQKLPLSERDFEKNILIPCMEGQIFVKPLNVKNYDWEHASLALGRVNAIRLEYNTLAESGDMAALRVFYDKNLAVADIETVTAFFRRFLDEGLNDGEKRPALAGKSNAEIRKLLAAHMTSDYAPQLAEMDRGFLEVKVLAEKKLGIAPK